MRITTKQFSDYVLGWLLGETTDTTELTMNAMKAALKNSLNMIEDDQDGIVAVEERWKFLEKTVNNKTK